MLLSFEPARRGMIGVNGILAVVRYDQLQRCGRSRAGGQRKRVPCVHWLTLKNASCPKVKRNHQVGDCCFFLFSFSVGVGVYIPQIGQ